MGADLPGKKLGFINGDEAVEHFHRMSRLDLTGFKNKSLLKVWPGMPLAIYRHHDAQVNPTILAKFKVLDLGFDSNGGYAKILNLSTAQTFSVNHVPNLIPGYDVAASFPHRPMFERTIYLREGAGPSYGVCAGLLVYHRNAVTWSVSGQDCLEPWMCIKNQFTDEGAFAAECERLARLTLI